MNLNYSLAYLILYGIEPFLWVTAFNKIFISRNQKKYKFLASMGLYLLIVIRQINVFTNNSSLSAKLYTPFLILCLYLYLHIFYENTIYEKIICISILLLTGTVTDVLGLGTGYLLRRHMDSGVITHFGRDNLLCTVFARIYTVSIYFILFSKRRLRSAYTMLSGRDMVIVLVPNILITMLFYYMIHKLDLFSQNYIAIFGVLVLDIFSVSYITICVVSESSRKKQKTEKEISARLNNVEQELRLYTEIENTIDELRKLRHDMKSHLQTIHTLCEEGHCQEMRDYISNLDSEVEKANDLYLIQNTKAAILLNIKKRIAKEHGIEFISNIMTDSLNIKDTDCCSLLTNLLNNALEAVEKQPDGQRKFIRLIIDRNEEGCQILCENSMNQNPIVRDGKIITTKGDTKSHGLGITIIRDIVVKYSGNVRFYYADGCFSVRIFIKDTN